MPITRAYFDDQNFLITTIAGEIDEETFTEYIVSLNELSEGITNLRELSDCREAIEVNILKTNAIRRAASREAKKPGSSLAIVIQDTILAYALARVYQTFASSMRKEIEIFVDVEKALAWLSREKGDLQELRQAMGLEN